MPVSFDQSTKIFRLDTTASTYALKIYDQGYLVHLYYGAKLPAGSHLSYLCRRGYYDSFAPHNPKLAEDLLFSLDYAPLEYPCEGVGDPRITAVEAVSPAGDNVTDLRYVSHRIFKGKPALPGLPATFACDSEAESLEIETQDPVTGLKAFLLYTVFSGYDAMTRSVRFENSGGAPLKLNRALSACLELPSMDYDLIHMSGRWNKEHTAERRPLRHGTQGVGSKRGMTGHGHNPFAALLRHGAGEDQGEAIGVNLVYSGNFTLEAEVDSIGCTRLLAGINPTGFCWRLEPGETFQTPEAVMVFSSQGLGGMSRTFHKLYMDHLIRGRWAKAVRPVLINSWEAAFFDFDDQLLVDFAKEAKELGIDMLVMDDGWFGDRCDDKRALGDWWVNQEKLKGGLGSLIQRVNAQGLKFGIWYEPEMISEDSTLYREHPDWVICAKGRSPSYSRSQYVLDMTRPQVRDNIFHQMEQVIANNNIEYIKWDCNRNISEAGSAVLPPERGGEFYHRYVLGLYDLMGRIVDRFPHILLENCSGGGGRFDPGMLYYSPQIWTSDNTDPIERLTIQMGASLCYPPACMGAHVSANPRAGFKTKAAVAMMGTFGYELDPRKLTKEDRELVRSQVADYHKYYDLTHYGDLYRLSDPTKDRFFCDWELVSPDKTQVLFTRIVMTKPDSHYMPRRLSGLDPEKLYTDEETGQVYNGAVLMAAGLDLSPYSWEDIHQMTDGGCIVKHLIAK